MERRRAENMRLRTVGSPVAMFARARRAAASETLTVSTSAEPGCEAGVGRLFTSSAGAMGATVHPDAVHANRKRYPSEG